MRISIFLWSSILVLIFFSSCIQQKNVVYFHENSFDSTTVVNEIYRIQKEDVLNIETKSLSQDNIDYILNSGGGSNRMNNEISLLLSGYLVDLQGNIELPLIGEINVEGLTIIEIENLINEELKKYIKNIYVNVRLLNYRVTVLGEVNAPNTYNFYNNSVTIFEALSRAGDINDYGNKRNVMLIRQLKDKKVTYKLDMTNMESMGSEFYYLFPNDIIYVQPIKGKFFRENLPIYSFVISSITTFILILNYIQS
jgi:polysaccharide biosynthesis/export protein